MFCFFFKQKTAYEMRISDWSSDVCSSDLHMARHDILMTHLRRHGRRRLGLNGDVIFTGTVPQSEIPGLLSISDVLVSPRLLGTNTPLKIYAYMRTDRKSVV